MICRLECLCLLTERLWCVDIALDRATNIVREVPTFPAMPNAVGAIAEAAQSAVGAVPLLPNRRAGPFAPAPAPLLAPIRQAAAALRIPTILATQEAQGSDMPTGSAASDFESSEAPHGKKAADDMAAGKG
jgi:hypothetical protein